MKILHQREEKKTCDPFSGEVISLKFTSDHFLPNALAEQILLVIPAVLLKS